MLLIGCACPFSRWRLEDGELGLIATAKLSQVTLGTALFWIWTLVEMFVNLKRPAIRQMHAECFPASSVCLMVLLTISLLTAEVLIFMKLERRLDHSNWLTTCLPVHVFFGTVFVSSLAAFCQNPVWQNPTSRKILATIGIVDSLVLESITVVVLLKLDSPALEIWNYTIILLALGMPLYTFILMVVQLLGKFGSDIFILDPIVLASVLLLQPCCRPTLWHVEVQSRHLQSLSF